MKIYTDLDSLFDTRYPIIKELTNIDDDTYMHRYNDNFKYIGIDLFNYLYKYRVKDLLKESAPTTGLDLIKENVTYEKAKQQMEGATDNIVLNINVWPYRLNNDELEIFKKVYSKEMKDLIDVDVFYKELSLKEIFSYDTIVSYEGLHLIDKAVFEIDLRNNPIPNTTLICPAVIDNHIDLKDYGKTGEILMKQYEPYINVQLVGVNMFSGIFQ